MGKLLSSQLKLNIQKGLLSISSAWEPVKGAVRWGLVRRAWWVMFSKGSQGQGGAIRDGQGRPTEPAASAPILNLLALSPVLRKPFC